MHRLTNSYVTIIVKDRVKTRMQNEYYNGREMWQVAINSIYGVVIP